MAGDIPDPEAVYEELGRYQQRLRQALDLAAQQPPVSLEPTEYDIIAAQDGVSLRYYRPGVCRPEAVPLLMVYALVNRPSILDLSPERSFIKDLLARGIPVYLLDWGRPQLTDAGLSLTHYLRPRLSSMVEQVLSRHGLSSLDVLGVCQGGVFALMHAALQPKQVRRLITMITPVDFHVPDFVLSNLVRQLDCDLLQRRVPLVPGQVLNQLFLSLKPLQHSGIKALALLKTDPDAERLADFLQMETWIHDCPDLVGSALAEFVRDFFQANLLCRNGLSLGAEPVLLSNIVAPVLNIYALRDHLVPPTSSRALANCLPQAKYREVAIDAGHIGIYINRLARKSAVDAIAAHVA